MSSLRIVVLGGTGFLGSAVCRVLRGLPDVDATLLVAGRRPAHDGDEASLSGDRNDAAFLAELVAWHPDVWIDLALFTPDQMEGLLSAFGRCPHPPRLVVAGSVAEYGLHRRLPLPVGENEPLEPEGSYGCDKAAAWKLLAAAPLPDWPAGWAVIPQLWGPGDRHGRDAVYVDRIRQGKPVLLRGNGRTLLPDGYVGTVAEAVVHLALNAQAGVRRYNVAGRSLLTPLSFLRWTARALDMPLHVRHVGHRDMPGQFRPVFGDYDLALDTRALRQSGFVQTASAAAGVAATAVWHRDHRTGLSPRFLRAVEMADDGSLPGVMRTYRD